jgi:hypothetical protein
MKRRLMWRVKNVHGDEQIVPELTLFIRQHYPEVKRVLVLKGK